ncbi:MAG: hypothetical protein ACT6WE_22275 [Shinella sp.]|uniref:hypothetical protein n=1 Tax=Shinella sp. TaxID=1870904 RepID=UPI004036F86F
MHTIPLSGRSDFSEWRDAARALAAAGISPREADWRIRGLDDELFAVGSLPDLPKPDKSAPPLTVPPAFLPLAEAVVCHTEPGRFHLLLSFILRLDS